MSQSGFGLSKELTEELLHIFAKYYHIEKVLIFGARARGEFDPYDDMEFCVFGEEIYHDEWYEIMDDIDELYTPAGFNMVQAHKIKQEELKKITDHEGIVFFERK